MGGATCLIGLKAVVNASPKPPHTRECRVMGWWSICRRLTGSQPNESCTGTAADGSMDGACSCRSQIIAWQQRRGRVGRRNRRGADERRAQIQMGGHRAVRVL
ncbi:hypothetical protein SEVIR_2G402801v4 [Setaria viridis]|uniref:Uncharacterized protein n=1 Tax=Setaria viridis TaxID=4556 RepID=A0A4U6W0G3_SETVI|nr:hypothetical protein SEVIR_2G402801v2 [Setaria viridis]